MNILETLNQTKRNDDVLSKKGKVSSGINILSDQEFKERITEVFGIVADSVSKTLGPYGQTTIIEKFGEMHVTKDGWTVLKGIKFAENVDNNILYLLTKIASQVVIKVGDGSTSSIVAANRFLNRFKDSNLLNINYAPRDFIKDLNKVVEIIINKIRSNAVVISNEDFDEARDRKIFDIAMISTNGNEEISKIISDIYAETQNPSISFVKGKYSNHYKEIINGYKTSMRLLDAIYYNDEQGACRKDVNASFILFDHRVDPIHVERIIDPIKKRLNSEGKTLYVIAPYYDGRVLERIKHETTILIRQNPSLIRTIYCKCDLINNLQRVMYDDLAALLGCTVVDTTVAEVLIKASEPVDENKETKLVTEDYNIIPDDITGSCGSVVINLKDAVFANFDNIQEDLHKLHITQASQKYQEMKERDEKLDLVTPELADLKTRLSKLRCKMGIINVGGASTLEQAANMDLVDDAVRSCENAFSNGYTIGCSLAIPFAIQQLFEECGFNEQAHKDIATLIANTFKDVYAQIILNKISGTGSSDSEISSYINNTINSSYLNKLPIDLTTGKASDKVINPVETDVEILKATSSIIALLLTSNQYLKIFIRDGEMQQ